MKHQEGPCSLFLLKSVHVLEASKKALCGCVATEQAGPSGGIPAVCPRAAGSEAPFSSIHNTCRALELSHLLQEAALLHLAASLLSGPGSCPSCRWAPASFSCSWVVVTLCLERGPHSALPPALQPLLRPARRPKLSQGKLGRGEVPGAGPHIPPLRARASDAPGCPPGSAWPSLGLRSRRLRARLVLLLAWYTSCHPPARPPPPLGPLEPRLSASCL